MMTRIGVFFLAGMLMISLLAHPTTATARPRTDNHVTQSELALLLVNVLGLYRYLPSPPSAINAIEILMVNGIAPADGWEPGKLVTRADLARVIVLAMDMGDEVENPDDPQSWVDFLVSIGVPIDTVGSALENVDPMGEPVAPYLLAGSAATDPLHRQTIFGEPDEVAFGTDMTFISSEVPLIVTWAEIREVIVRIPRVPPPRRPVTPVD